jgi:hypothetical protein
MIIGELGGIFISSAKGGRREYHKVGNILSSNQPQELRDKDGNRDSTLGNQDLKLFFI